MARTVAGIHGITPDLTLAGFYVVRTRTGRKLAVSDRTRRLMALAGNHDPRA